MENVPRDNREHLSESNRPMTCLDATHIPKALESSAIPAIIKGIDVQVIEDLWMIHDLWKSHILL